MKHENFSEISKAELEDPLRHSSSFTLVSKPKKSPAFTSNTKIRRLRVNSESDGVMERALPFDIDFG